MNIFKTRFPIRYAFEFVKDNYISVGCTIAVVFYICNATNNLDYVKEHAPDKWKQQGFEVVDYEGYSWGVGVGEYGGAQVWHRLKKIPDNGVTYSGSIVRWGDELHVYGPNATEGTLVQSGTVE